MLEQETHNTPFPCVEINKNSELPTIVFISGFPDSELSGWGSLLPQIRTHRLLFFCLPGYSLRCRFSNEKALRPWGYNHDELQALLHDSLSTLLVKGEKVHLVTHDWGSHIGTRYQNAHPDRIKSLTMIDIGICSLWTLPIAHAVPIAAYQIWFAISYLLTQVVGMTLATIFFKIYFWIPIFQDYKPNPKKVHVPVSSITPLMCYPYFYLLAELLTGGMNLPTFPSCPTLYLYGSDKKAYYHDEGFLESISKRVDCRYAKFNAGHWPQVTQPEEVFREIETFISKNSN